MLSAHIDTVFPLHTPISPLVDNNRLEAPGACDNGAGVAGILALAAALDSCGIELPCDLLFAGNVGEEGEGDLRGMRYLYGASPWFPRIGANVVLDGAGCEVVVTQGLGSRRYLVTMKGPGGHSWTDAGTPNPIVVLSRAIAAMSDVALPTSPRTTLNIGTIEGGSSVNSIPEFATARFDLRSLEAEQLVGWKWSCIARSKMRCLSPTSERAARCNSLLSALETVRQGDWTRIRRCSRRCMR